MEHYLVGIIEVNPKEILDAGIRKELIKLIAKYLNSNFVFDNV
jgi:WASH complex subunit strumpellin